MRADWKRALKQLRCSQPFNRIATGATRGLLDLFHARPAFIVRHLHRVGDVRSRLPNGRLLRLWSRADDWVSNLIYWRGWAGYEPETTPLFYLLATRAQVTVDVGAYVGFYTLLAAHANPAARVIAFEPLAEAFARLRDHVRLNALANVACVPMALGHEASEAELFRAPAAAVAAIASDGQASIPCSSSLSADFMRGVPGAVGAPVRVAALDGYLSGRQVERVDLVKIDTESTEPDVLAGALATLRTSHPAIVCEVLPGSGTGPRLEALLFPLGYRAYQLTPRGPEARDRVDGHPEWLNYLFSVQAEEEILLLHREALRCAGLASS